MVSSSWAYALCLQWTRRRFPLLLSLLLLAGSTQSSSADSNPKRSSPPLNSAFVSPTLATSWAASRARGTVVAVSYSDGIVLVTCKPKEKKFESENDKEKPVLLEEEVDGISVHHSQSNRPNQQQKHPFLCINSRGVIVACTGLVSDVHYLLHRVLMGRIDQDDIIYGDGGGGDANGSSGNNAVKKVTSYLKEALLRQSSSSRPLGLQALVIGTRTMDSRSNSEDETSETVTIVNDRHHLLFTLDPSGGHRHWAGGATAIGAKDLEVREALAQHLLQSPPEGEKGITMDAKAALAAALASLRKVNNDNSGERDGDPDDENYAYAAWLVCRRNVDKKSSPLRTTNSRRLCLLQVSRKALQASKA